MKHLRFVFTALAIVGVVGGSLAFKASKFSQAYIFQKQQSGSCVELASQYNPDPTGGVITLTNAWSTSTTPTTTTTAVSLCTSSIRVNAEF